MQGLEGALGRVPETDWGPARGRHRGSRVRGPSLSGAVRIPDRGRREVLGHIQVPVPGRQDGGCREDAPSPWPSTAALRVDWTPHSCCQCSFKKVEALAPRSQPCPGIPEHRALA